MGSFWYGQVNTWCGYYFEASKTVSMQDGRASFYGKESLSQFEPKHLESLASSGKPAARGEQH